MRTANQYELNELVGRRVIALRDFSGIPNGTIGVVDEHYGRGRHQGVMVRWTTTNGSVVRDGFSRDEQFDETQFLAVIE